MIGNKNILLCGFMGCGKTTVGKALARRMFRDFLDLDELICQREGMSIPEIFAARGEEGFRQAEYEAVLSLERTTQKVIAAGGGTVTCERSCQALKKSCILFFINPGFEDCCRRILGDAGRPIAASSTREELQALYERRFPLYRQAADYEIYNHGTTADAVGAIIASLRDEF